jgi:hypothetical protein
MDILFYTNKPTISAAIYCLRSLLITLSTTKSMPLSRMYNTIHVTV